MRNRLFAVVLFISPVVVLVWDKGMGKADYHAPEHLRPHLWDRAIADFVFGADGVFTISN